MPRLATILPHATPESYVAAVKLYRDYFEKQCPVCIHHESSQVDPTRECPILSFFRREGPMGYLAGFYFDTHESSEGYVINCKMRVTQDDARL